MNYNKLDGIDIIRSLHLPVLLEKASRVMAGSEKITGAFGAMLWSILT